MRCFQIKIVDTVFSVTTEHEATRLYCADYLADELPEIHISVSRDDVEFERAKGRREGLTYGALSDSALEVTALQRKITEQFFRRNTLLFHGSVVAVDGVGYLFTAQSGTGKSTHTRLWREQFGDRAVMINDDKPFLQLTDSGVLVWGSPWNGKHRLGSNISVPLKAICILERSPENRIEPITAAQALPMLFQQSQRPQNPANMAKYMELIDKLANGVQFWKMGCNMDPEAALVSYEAMSGGRKGDL